MGMAWRVPGWPSDGTPGRMRERRVSSGKGRGEDNEGAAVLCDHARLTFQSVWTELLGHHWHMAAGVVVEVEFGVRGVRVEDCDGAGHDCGLLLAYSIGDVVLRWW